MPDRKHVDWVADYSTDAEHIDDARRVNHSSQAANDADGWEHYRKWVSKAPAPRRRRTGIDPALYTWRGYRNWTDQVRRNWNPDAGDDTE